MGHGPFHNRADPLPDPLGRFGFGVPDRGEDAHDVARRQLRHGHVRYCRVRVLPECALPLGGVLGVAPRWPEQFERRRCGLLERGYGRAPSFREGIAAPFGDAGVFEVGRPGIGQRDDGMPAQPDFACAPSDCDALHPALRALRRDHEPEAVAAAPVAVLSRGRGLHQRRRQSFGACDFRSPQYFPVYGWEYTGMIWERIKRSAARSRCFYGEFRELPGRGGIASGGGAVRQLSSYIHFKIVN